MRAPASYCVWNTAEDNDRGTLSDAAPATPMSKKAILAL